MSVECVECCLPDPYNGHGDGIGSCDCPRCDCGECKPCAVALSLCRCYDDDDWIWEDDGGGWDSYDYGPAIVSIEPKGDVL